MNEIKIMHDKEFSKTLDIIPSDDRKIEAGTFKDDNITVVFTIHPIEKQKLNLKVRFKKHPQTYPFWVKIDVKINDEIDHFIFARFQNSKLNLQQNFHTIFTKQSLSNGVTINYKLHHVPANTSTLSNRKCLCYLNSVIQILFHLSNFRSAITSSSTLRSVSYVKEMKSLFNKMIQTNDCHSTEDLVVSFGWPEEIALGIQQDAAEFLDFLLNDISNRIPKKHLEGLYTSVLAFKPDPDAPITRPIKKENINIIRTDLREGPLINIMNLYLKRDHGVLQFEKYPKILFVQVDGELGTFEDKIDLSIFQSSEIQEKLPHSHYTLSGLIIREARKGNKNSGHFKCLVRSPCEELWHYFSDDVHGFYNVAERRKLSEPGQEVTIQTIYKEVSNQSNSKSEIKSLFESRILVLVYVADDVYKDAFNPDTKLIPSKRETQKNDNKEIKSCTFKVISDEKLIEHIKEGNPDFKSIKESCSIEMTTDEKKSDLYKKVSTSLKLDINSFTLRNAEKQCGEAPSCYIIENSDSSLEFQDDKCTIYCFKEDKPIKDSPSVPIIFLSFEFKPRLFLGHLANNLNYSSLVSPHLGDSNQNLSQRVRKVNIYKFQKIEDQPANENKQNIELKQYSKYNFPHLSTEFLKPNQSLAEVKSKLLEKMGKPQDSKIAFYINEKESSNIELISFKNIEIDSQIKTFNNQNVGRIIFVQCLDELIDVKEKDVLDKVIDVKFLFFKYKDLAFNTISNPRTLPLSFLMEKFSIPVKICKLDDPINTQKTMLFPVKNELDINELNKIICTAMNENYNEKNFMQIFLSFRKETVPFAEAITNMNTLNRALYYNLSKKYGIITQNLYTSLSNDLPDNFKDDSDIDYEVNPYIIHIHYKIFGEIGKKIPIRIYFSDNSYRCNFLTQFLKKPDKMVSSLIKKFLKVYTNYESLFSEKDIQDFESIKNKQKKFSDVYQLLKITNCKISAFIKEDYCPGNNVSIRIQRIPDYLSDPNFIGFIPVYYGAQYNNKDLVIAFGDPFLFPIYEEDLEIYSEQDLKHSKSYARLIENMNLTNYEKFSLFVTNYEGVILKIEPFAYEEIMVSKDNMYIESIHKFIAISVQSYHNNYPINAASFFDETAYFKNYPFRILQK